MKTKYILLFFSVCLLYSCTTHVSPEKQDAPKQDKELDKNIELMKKAANDSIQRTFMGATFGDSKEEVVRRFRNHGLIVDKNLSNDVIISFMSVNGTPIPFGGFLWSKLQTEYINNRLISIHFYNPFKNKNMALEKGKIVYNAVSKKYNMVTVESEDKNKYFHAWGAGANNTVVMITIDQYEDVFHGLYYGVHLLYCNGSDLVNSLSASNEEL